MSMMTNSMASSGDQTAESGTGTGVSDMMAPLMMMLLEKLVEQQLDTSAVSTDTTQKNVSAAPTSSTVSSPQVSKTEPSGRPVGGFLTQGFHPGHNGLDFGVVVGTPVKATMDGKVIYAGPNDQGYGNLVIVENGAYRTYYAHLSSIPVAVGDTVTAESTIGLSGNTGHSTGPHLHYEIRKNNVPIDPTSVTLGTIA